jgi:tripartite-type tricarboxylate transporter receptor subunit TctC
MIAYTFNVLLAPARTPRPIIEQLHQASLQVTRDEGFQKSAEGLGIEPITDSTPEKALTTIQAELAKWAPVAKSAGMKRD